MRLPVSQPEQTNRNKNPNSKATSVPVGVKCTNPPNRANYRLLNNNKGRSATEMAGPHLRTGMRLFPARKHALESPLHRAKTALRERFGWLQSRTRPPSSDL